MSEPRQVDRDEVRVLGEPCPHRLEGEQAFWPRAQHQRVVALVTALGESNRKAVDHPELHLNGRVKPGGHDVPPRYPRQPVRLLRWCNRLAGLSTLASARAQRMWPVP